MGYTVNFKGMQIVYPGSYGWNVQHNGEATAVARFCTENELTVQKMIPYDFVIVMDKLGLVYG
jgi:hypothetical protein